MGDRANVYVSHGKITIAGAIERDEGVYIYTHWGGEGLPFKVQAALRKKWRWTDAQYLTRILYDEIVGKEFFKTETSFGLSPSLGDNEHPIIRVDVPRQTVSFVAEGQERLSEPDTAPTMRYGETEYTPQTWTFDAFVELPLADVEAAWR